MLKIQNRINVFLENASNFLLKKKFQSVKKCLAFDFDATTNDYTKSCRKITKFQYCKTHYKLMIESCNKYHFFNKFFSSNISEAVVIESELHCRRVYCKRFNIILDVGHAFWEDKLQKRLWEIENQAQIMNHYLKDDIFYGIPSLFDVKNSIYNLEIGVLLENDMKDSEYFNHEGWNRSDSKLSKYKMNLYLFDMFLSRSSLNKINYLNCFLF